MSDTRVKATDSPPPPGLVTPRPQLRKPRSRPYALTVRALGPFALLGLWWAASATGLLTPDVLASPAEVLRAVGELWATASCPTRSPPP
ncbi:ABC transporter permease OS=Streptomyces microflavus OX=1919 GN=G3I39_16350 PE=3 SV=1 [Streptomyces microflavus]